jgi:hypothetical protein
MIRPRQGISAMCLILLHGRRHYRARNHCHRTSDIAFHRPCLCQRHHHRCSLDRFSSAASTAHGGNAMGGAGGLAIGSALRLPALEIVSRDCDRPMASVMFTQPGRLMSAFKADINALPEGRPQPLRLTFSWSRRCTAPPHAVRHLMRLTIAKQLPVVRLGRRGAQL